MWYSQKIVVTGVCLGNLNLNINDSTKVVKNIFLQLNHINVCKLSGNHFPSSG